MDLLRQEPVDNPVMRPGMPQQILLLVGRFPELGIAVPAGMDEQDIALAHFDTLFDHLRGENIELIEHVAQVDDHPRAVAPLERNLVDRSPAGDKVPGRIEVRAHVVRRHDVLGVDPMLRLPLDVLHLKRRIERPERHVLVERLREVIDLGLAHRLPSLLLGRPVPHSLCNAARPSLGNQRAYGTWVERHARDADAERSQGIVERGSDHRRHRDRPRLANPLHPKRVQR